MLFVTEGHCEHLWCSSERLKLRARIYQIRSSPTFALREHSCNKLRKVLPYLVYYIELPLLRQVLHIYLIKQFGKAYFINHMMNHPELSLREKK